MAEGTSLKMKFDTMSGSKTWTFKNAKVSATAEQVKNLGAVMVAAGDFFSSQPVRLVDARIVTTTESAYDLDS